MHGVDCTVASSSFRKRKVRTYELFHCKKSSGIQKNSGIYSSRKRKKTAGIQSSQKIPEQKHWNTFQPKNTGISNRTGSKHQQQDCVGVELENAYYEIIISKIIEISIYNIMETIKFYYFLLFLILLMN